MTADRDLIPGSDGISPAVRRCIADRFCVGARQYPGDTYLSDGTPRHSDKAYLEKIGRHWARALTEFESGIIPEEDHLAAVVCDAILLMQLRARHDYPVKKP